MGKKILITGATGMVGGALLELCLAEKGIEKIISFVRKKQAIQHDIVEQVEVPDFMDLSAYNEHFENVDAIFYCIGVYSGAVPKDVFRKITVDYPVHFAKSIYARSPQATFCLLSGQGADRSEKSKIMFARDKGAAENQLATIGFAGFHSFRPGYIYPVKKRKEPNLMYTISRGLYPILKHLGANTSIPSDQLAQAMLSIGLNGGSQEIYENKDMRNLLQ